MGMEINLLKAEDGTYYVKMGESIIEWERIRESVENNHFHGNKHELKQMVATIYDAFKNEVEDGRK